eukprot:COSAG01_NODE_8910_length_2618_cov_5.533545_1_plen_94_part_00
MALTAIQDTDPNSAEWTTVVAPLITSLIAETLPILSAGWGDGVAVGFVNAWLTALGCFCYYMYLCYRSAFVLVSVHMPTELPHIFTRIGWTRA